MIFIWYHTSKAPKHTSKQHQNIPVKHQNIPVKHQNIPVKTLKSQILSAFREHIIYINVI